jgi:glycosyltransferase involved in cell wall biosynthesis
VATAVGGTAEVVDSGHGILVPPSDPEALGDAIARLAGDPGRRKRMGEVARERFLTEFEINVWADRLATIYREVLAGER